MRYLYFIPKRSLSRATGWLVSRQLPRPIANWSVRKFAQAFKINLDEAEHPIDQYPSISDFFIRKIKMEARPIGAGNVLHPADAVISQAGTIREGELIQAKGKKYTVFDLLDSKDPKKCLKFSEGGSFLTYYLCPTDYHRVHSPVSGRILRYHHIPGDLWPVNTWSVENIDRLFGINERVAVEIETTQGTAMVVFVGATNVGQISLSFDQSFRTNSLQSEPKVYSPLEPIPIEKGEELGIFHMGSTVVMLYSKEMNISSEVLKESVGKSVRVRANLEESKQKI